MRFFMATAPRRERTTRGKIERWNDGMDWTSSSSTKLTCKIPQKNVHREQTASENPFHHLKKIDSLAEKSKAQKSFSWRKCLPRFPKWRRFSERRSISQNAKMLSRGISVKGH